MGDWWLSISHNVSKITVFQSHGFRMESISTSMSGRSMEENEYMIRESIWESFANREGEISSQVSKIRHQSSFAKAVWLAYWTNEGPPPSGMYIKPRLRMRSLKESISFHIAFTTLTLIHKSNHIEVPHQGSRRQRTPSMNNITLEENRLKCCIIGLIYRGDTKSELCNLFLKFHQYWESSWELTIFFKKFTVLPN